MAPKNMIRKENTHFFAKLNQEISSVEMAGSSIFIELDANSKLGRELIPGDPCATPTENGNLLIDIISMTIWYYSTRVNFVKVL